MFFRRFPFFLFLLLALPIGLSLPARAQNFTFLDDEGESSGYDVTAQITARPAEFLLSHSESGDAYNLKFTAQALQLWKIKNKVSALLAQAPLPTFKFPAAFVAQRRGPRWRFILNAQVVLEAEDDAFAEGQIGVKGGIKDARVQPIEPIQFQDDFMRVAKDVAMRDAIKNPHAGVKIATVQLEESIWSVAAGRFATTGLTENADAQVAQSANPFAFRPLSLGDNLALSGRPFWSDYSASVAVQPQGASEIGLLVYAQDAKNYLGLFWSDKSGPQLRAVVNGIPKVLDSAPQFGPFEINQWNRLRLEVAGGQLRGYVDDTEVVRGRTGLFGRGQVGIWAKLPVAGDDKQAIGGVFDDADVHSLTDFYDDFSRNVPGRWTTIAGNWDWTGTAHPLNASGAYGVMGEADWQEYRVSGDLQVPADGSVGLLLHHIAGKGAYLLRVTGSKAKTPAAGRAQIVLIAGGKNRVLGETIVKNRYDGSKLRWNFGAQDGYLDAKVGDEMIVDAFDTTLPQGRPGVYAQNGSSGASISDFSVEWPQKTSSWAKVPDLYEVDQQAATMGSWSTPQGFWVTRANSDQNTPNSIWHKGEFFGDEDVSFNLPDLAGDKSLKLLFVAKNGTPLTLTLTQKDALNVDLSAGGKTSTGNAKLATGAPLEIERRGTYFIVRSGETVVLATRL